MKDARLLFLSQSYVGRGAAGRLPEEIRKRSAARILLVADPMLVRLGLADRIVEPVRAGGCQVDIFSEVVPEPTLELGERLVEATRKGGYDLIVGMGGGSSLDLAKLAAVLSVHEGKVSDYMNLTGLRKIEKPGLPKIMIPTTSGTGSEVTNIAVLALEQTKDVIVHDYMLPDLALVDPELTLTVPPRVTAATGMDALTHAIEAYLSVFASPVTDALALHAVRLGGAWLKRAVSDGTDLEAREAMCQSSFMAGLAFFNAGVGGVHALAYPLGGQFHLPHGEANAVLLPYVMNRIRPACQDRMSDLLLAIGGEGAANNAEEASQRFVSLLHELNRAIGIPATLQAYGIEASHLNTLVRDALDQKRLLARSPMPLTETDIFAIYEAALLGRV